MVDGTAGRRVIAGTVEAVTLGGCGKESEESVFNFIVVVSIVVYFPIYTIAWMVLSLISLPMVLLIQRVHMMMTTRRHDSADE